MKRFGEGLLKRLTSAKLVQKLVLGWTVSPAYGLLKADPQAYNKVAVEGVRLSNALKEITASREVNTFLSSLPKGGEKLRTLESSLKLISQLIEVDVSSRERWVYAAITASISMAMVAAIMAAMGKVIGLQVLVLAALPLILYPFVPSSPPLPKFDPSSADSVASSLEVGGGRAYALRNLGLYKELVVDHTLEEVELPLWAEVLKELSGRKYLALIMRRTANLLRDLKRLEKYWEEKMKGLKATVMAMCALLGVTNTLLLRSIILLPFSGAYSDLKPILLLLGTSYSLLASKPVRAELPAILSYLASFMLSDYLIS